MPDPTPLAAPTVIRRTFARPGERAWVRVSAAATRATVFVNGASVGAHLGAWTPFAFEITPVLRDQNELEIRCEDCLHLTNGFLPVLKMRWTGARDVQITTEPPAPRPAARQRSATRGTQLLVDGRPFRVRGILHWGYYPELGNPWPGEDQMRREIAELKALGFNLIKFCLWVPPARYYELCDELGMFVWQEYPVWDAPLAASAEARGALGEADVLGEFRELFAHDAPFGCVILRTLTCENDRVDAGLAAKLIALARETIPGCVILTNSSWLCKNGEGDFHDEHPYLHNAQWPFYANRFEGKLTKPLLLGESITVDTLPEGRGKGGTWERGNVTAGSAPDGEHLSTVPPSHLPTVEESRRIALEVRRFQVETFVREFPDAGYVLTGLRDIENAPCGIYTIDGRPKYTPEEWSWQAKLEAGREISERPGSIELVSERIRPLAASQPYNLATPARIPSVAPSHFPTFPPSHAGSVPVGRGPIIGPRKGEWKCPEYTWWSPIVRVLDDSLPRELIQRESVFELLSGRVLSHAEGTRVLVEVLDYHGHVEPRRLPLVVEFTSQGRRMFASAFRHDTPAGRELFDVLTRRTGDAPEIGKLVGTSVVLDQWQMFLPSDPAAPFPDPRAPLPVSTVSSSLRPLVPLLSDTPLVNAGRNVFEGWAIFRTRFDYPGGKRTLRCEAVCDYFALRIDDEFIAEAGPRDGTWDGTRDIPREYPLELPPGEHEIEFRVRDWRGAGGMVGPVYIYADFAERIF